MNGPWPVARAVHALRRAPDLAAIRAAVGPAVLADRALVPAGRHLGVAIRLLPGPVRAEATAAFLACRVLDAFEDLGGPDDGPPARAGRVVAAVGYLCGRPVPAPAPPTGGPARDVERVDLILAARIGDVRALVAALPPPRRDRVRVLLAGVGAAMAANLRDPLPRDRYGAAVLGRVAAYAADLLTDGAGHDATDLYPALGTIAQLANDLRDGDGGTGATAVRRTYLGLLPLAVSGFAALAVLGSTVRGRGARAAVAYTAVTTTSFLCRRVGARGPYPRRLRLVAALAAGVSRWCYTATLRRMAAAAERAVAAVVAAPPGHDPDLFDRDLFDSGPFGEDGFHPGGRAGPRTAAAFRIVAALPRGPLTGPATADHRDAVRLMLADHLVFDAVDDLDPDRVDDLADLADLVRRAAVEEALR